MACIGIAGVEDWTSLRKNSGDYCRVHRQVKAARGNADMYSCIQCGDPAQSWAWQHGSDPLDHTNYEPMCWSCHNTYDYTDETRAKLSAARIGNTNAIGNTHNQGSGNGQAKLTETQVRTIRACYAAGVSRRALAEQFGLHPMSVGPIIRRERWRHI